MVATVHTRAVRSVQCACGVRANNNLWNPWNMPGLYDFWSCFGSADYHASLWPAHLDLQNEWSFEKRCLGRTNQACFRDFRGFYLHMLDMGHGWPGNEAPMFSSNGFCGYERKFQPSRCRLGWRLPYIKEVKNKKAGSLTRLPVSSNLIVWFGGFAVLAYASISAALAAAEPASGA